MKKSPRYSAPKSSNEMFYLVDCKKQDAALHEQILNEGFAGPPNAVKNERFRDNPVVRVTGPDGKEIPMAEVIKKTSLEKKALNCGVEYYVERPLQGSARGWQQRGADISCNALCNPLSTKLPGLQSGRIIFTTPILMIMLRYKPT